MTRTSPTLHADHPTGQQPAMRWAELADHIRTLPYSDPRVMAYTLTLRRLGRGQQAKYRHHNLYCPVCAARLVAAYEGEEQKLLDCYCQNLEEVLHTLDAMRAKAHQSRLERAA